MGAPSALRFVALIAQLAVLTAATHFLYPRWFPGVCLAVAGFAVHYWLPIRWKEPFWFALSAGGMLLYGGPFGAALVAVGLGSIYALCRVPGPWLLRLGLLLAMAPLVVVVGRVLEPPMIYNYFAAFTMIHGLVYLYEVKFMPVPPRPFDFVRHFVWLPLYVFAPFLVPGYHELKRSFMRRPAHVVAQKGIARIVLGAAHLLVVLVVTGAYGHPVDLAAPITLDGLALLLFRAYVGYLQVSGTIHLSVGMMQVFGYDLPKPYDWFPLASSPLDLWRRINIYWKDAMMRLFYMPIYFALRRRSDTAARLLGLVAALVMSGVFHVWILVCVDGFRRFWYPTEMAFWLLLALLAAGNSLWTARRREQPTVAAHALRALRVAAMLITISSLFLLSWTASIGEWARLVTGWL
jgi:alginate O-acetyltransferase complex protein AlgI